MAGFSAFTDKLKNRTSALNAFVSNTVAAPVDKKTKKKKTIDDFSAKEIEAMSDEDYLRLISQ